MFSHRIIVSGTEVWRHVSDAITDEVARMKSLMRDSIYFRFKQGFLNAATSTSTWILTGGTTLGIDGYITDLLNERIYQEWIGVVQRTFNLIGIANWNCVDQHEQILQVTKIPKIPNIIILMPFLFPYFFITRSGLSIFEPSKYRECCRKISSYRKNIMSML